MAPDATGLSSRSFAIVINLEPGGAIAREHHAAVRIAKHRMTDWAAAGIRVNKKQPSQVLTPGLGTSRAIADRTDIHARRRFGLVDDYGFSTRAFSLALIHSSISALRNLKPERRTEFRIYAHGQWRLT